MKKNTLFNPYLIHVYMMGRGSRSPRHRRRRSIFRRGTVTAMPGEDVVKYLYDI